MKHLLLTGLFILFLSCQPTSRRNLNRQGHDVSVKYAELFSIGDYQNFKILRIEQAYPSSPVYTYVFSNSPKNIPDSLKDIPFIQTPVKHIVLTSTTHLPALTLLHEENSLVAFPGTQYVSSPAIRKKIDEKKIQEIGFQGRLNPEKVLALKPDLVMLFNSGKDIRNDDLYTRNGINTLYNADWMETTPLGRAEWIKVFGLLFGKEQLADSIFKQIAYRYNQVKHKIAGQKNRVRVFQGGKFGDKWFVPGGNSYAARLIKDAGGKYMWQTDKHNGSLQLNYENVLLNLPEADVWLNPGMYASQKELLRDIPEIVEMPAYKNNRIYTYNLKKGTTGGVLYFEYSHAHPDWVLLDLFHIFYPQDDEYNFHFYQKLP